MLRAWSTILLTGVAACTEPAFAAGGDERAALAARLAADRVKIRFLRNEEASILEGLQDLEKRLETAERRVVELDRERGALTAQIDEIAGRLTKNEAEIAQLRDAFGRRVAAMRRLAKARIRRLLERAKRPSDARRMRDRVERVRAFDLNLVRRVLDASATDRRLHQELVAKRARLQAAGEATEEEHASARTLRAERRALLDAVRKERISTQRLSRELRAAARMLDEQFGRLLGARPPPDPLPGGFADQKGRLPWPITGRLEVPYGKKVDPVSKVVLVHKGIDLRARFGQPIRAVFRGRVAYAEHRRGFGRLLIIDHEGFHTLYAHLDSFQVQRGQVVRQHQVVGTLGDSGSTKGAFLYFEIRRGRDTVDPLRWLLP